MNQRIWCIIAMSLCVCVCLVPFCRFKHHAVPSCKASTLRQCDTIVPRLEERDPVERCQCRREFWSWESSSDGGNWILPLKMRQKVARASLGHHALCRGEWKGSCSYRCDRLGNSTIYTGIFRSIQCPIEYVHIIRSNIYKQKMNVCVWECK